MCSANYSLARVTFHVSLRWLFVARSSDKRDGSLLIAAVGEAAVVVSGKGMVAAVVKMLAYAFC